MIRDINARASAKSGGNSSGTGLRTENYTRNRLNQYSQKDDAATFDVLGLANARKGVNGNDIFPFRLSPTPARSLNRFSGSRTYPVEYTDDSPGRMQTMKTGQSFSGKRQAKPHW